MPGKRLHQSSSIDSDSDFLDQDNVYLSIPAPADEYAHTHLLDAAPAADARGGPGGGGGGGGGGGPGGGGVVTSYTSGNPNIDDANEFNIKINFSGSWTAKQQS